jgi:hypothetical protein
MISRHPFLAFSRVNVLCDRLTYIAEIMSIITSYVVAPHFTANTYGEKKFSMDKSCQES